MFPAFLWILVLLLAFANGANDNFKGVATIYGSGISTRGAALAWGTVTTLSGSMFSLPVSEGLVRAFSGEDWVEPEVLSVPAFALVVAASAGSTVLLATFLGMPISTTHALVGALAGVAIMASSDPSWLPVLGMVFFLPMLTSPLVSWALSLGANRLVRAWEPACVCVARAERGLGSLPVLVSGSDSECCAHGAVPVLRSAWWVDGAHISGAGAVGFARGLSDTPKLVGILLIGGSVPADWSSTLAIGLAMAAGGILASRGVAKTIGLRLTPMSSGQGATTNLLTSLVVVAAGGLGLAVSTTHVSCGSIFGLGSARGELSRKWAAAVAASWLFTLPVSGGLAAGLWSWWA